MFDHTCIASSNGWCERTGRSRSRSLSGSRETITACRQNRLAASCSAPRGRIPAPRDGHPCGRPQPRPRGFRGRREPITTPTFPRGNREHEEEQAEGSPAKAYRNPTRHTEDKELPERISSAHLLGVDTCLFAILLSILVKSAPPVRPSTMNNHGLGSRTELNAVSEECLSRVREMVIGLEDPCGKTSGSHRAAQMAGNPDLSHCKPLLSGTTCATKKPPRSRVGRGAAGGEVPAMTDFRAWGTIMGLAGLTAVFGMGTGVAPPVSSPGNRPAGGQATPAASSR